VLPYFADWKRVGLRVDPNEAYEKFVEFRLDITPIAAQLPRSSDYTSLPSQQAFCDRKNLRFETRFGFRIVQAVSRILRFKIRLLARPIREVAFDLRW
jgi:hypothetical protein